MNAIERMREISCPCWQKDHPSGGFYEAVELTPGLTVYKSTLAENTLSLLVSVSPGSGLHLRLRGFTADRATSMCNLVRLHCIYCMYIWEFDNQKSGLRLS